MRRRYRGPILWIGLGVIVILAYVLSQPVPISTEAYRQPEIATPATDAATTADATAAGIAAVTSPAAEVAPAPVAVPEPVTPAATPEPARLPVPAQTPTPAPAAQAMFVNATSLNLRAAPEAGAAVLEVLPRGTRVDAVGTAEGWREVVNPATGTRGWMSAEYLTTAPPAAAATLAPAPAAAPAVTPAPGLVLLPN
jgi:hypothetical protein